MALKDMSGEGNLVLAEADIHMPLAVDLEKGIHPPNSTAGSSTAFGVGFIFIRDLVRLFPDEV